MSTSSKKENGSVLVTGASSGVGKATALMLLQYGYRVFATVRKEADAETLREAAPEGLQTVIMDVTNAKQIQAAVETVGNVVGNLGLAGLVNNAAVMVEGPLEFVSIDDLRRQFEVNVFGQIAVTQAFLPLIRKATGRIINIGSLTGRVSIPFFSPLSASKYALDSFTDALRMELYPWNIEVILIEPGTIATPAVDKMEQAAAETLEKMSPKAKAYYGDTFRSFVDKMTEESRKGLPAEGVAEAILEALEAERPKTRYPIGKEKAILVLEKFLPDRLFDALKLRAMGVE